LVPHPPLLDIKGFREVLWLWHWFPDSPYY
jgi:hypothetical protein